MSWLTAAWLMIASACLTLAAIHSHAAIRRKELGANAVFAAMTTSVASVAFIEMALFHADSTAEYGRLVWWYQLPIWSGVLALVGFVRLYLRVGRAWLGWTAVGLRTLAFAINLFSSPNINFREITSLQAATLFGETVSIAHGVPNPWMLVGQVSQLALIFFVAEAAWSLWRRGERGRAVTIGGTLVLFATAGTMVGVAALWGIVKLPLLVTVCFVPIVVAMGLEMSSDLVRVACLSADLGTKEEQLRSSEQRLALAADAANAGLWSIERTTARLWATPRALSMFGLAPDREYDVHDILNCIHADDREQLRRFVDDPKQAAARGSIEYRVMGPQGQIRWVASHGSSQEGNAQAPSTLMGATIDVTERKQAEDEAALQRFELEHLSRVANLSELSGTLAHEINQPLAIIMSNAEAAQRLLEHEVPDLTEVKAILEDIVSADERAGEVIKRLRSLLKRAAPNRQPISLDDVVRGVLRFMQLDLVRRGVTVELALGELPSKVLADRVPVEQVLINLISNACDAMAANAPGDRVLRIATSAHDGMAQVRIADVGSGLPELPDRVFEPFYTTKPEGLGLGLPISQSIIRAHGGRLWAAADADRGAMFKVCLPVQAEAT